MLPLLAIALATLWATTVALGVAGRRRGAAVAAGLTSVVATVPFLPRIVACMADSNRFIARYGTAAINEVEIGAALVALSFGALVAAILGVQRAWGWLPPSLLNLPPVVMVVWVAFWFRLF